jgi:hypothetical protein
MAASLAATVVAPTARERMAKMAKWIRSGIPQGDRLVRAASKPPVSRLGLLLPVAAALGVAGCERAVDPSPGIEQPTAGRTLYEATVRPDLAAGTLSAEWRFRFITDERTSDDVTYSSAR